MSRSPQCGQITRAGYGCPREIFLQLMRSFPLGVPKKSISELWAFLLNLLAPSMFTQPDASKKSYCKTALMQLRPAHKMLATPTTKKQRQQYCQMRKRIHAFLYCLTSCRRPAWPPMTCPVKGLIGSGFLLLLVAPLTSPTNPAGATFNCWLLPDFKAELTATLAGVGLKSSPLSLNYF